MKTGWESMRVGSIMYFLPFFFVMNPALVLQGSWVEAIYMTLAAGVGLRKHGIAAFGDEIAGRGVAQRERIVQRPNTADGYKVRTIEIAGRGIERKA